MMTRLLNIDQFGVKQVASPGVDRDISITADFADTSLSAENIQINDATGHRKNYTTWLGCEWRVETLLSSRQRSRTIQIT
jgi:hypothetical protein